MKKTVNSCLIRQFFKDSQGQSLTAKVSHAETLVQNALSRKMDDIIVSMCDNQNL